MSNLQNILKKPIVKYLLLSLLIIPIIPIVLNIVYINKYSGFNSSLRINVSLILIFACLSLLMFGMYCLNKNKGIGSLVTSVIAIVSIICSSYFGYVNMKV